MDGGIFRKTSEGFELWVPDAVRETETRPSEGAVCVMSQVAPPKGWQFTGRWHECPLTLHCVGQFVRIGTGAPVECLGRFNRSPELEPVSAHQVARPKPERVDYMIQVTDVPGCRPDYVMLVGPGGKLKAHSGAKLKWWTTLDERAPSPLPPPTGRIEHSRYVLVFVGRSGLPLKLALNALAHMPMDQVSIEEYPVRQIPHITSDGPMVTLAAWVVEALARLPDTRPTGPEDAGTDAIRHARRASREALRWPV